MKYAFTIAFIFLSFSVYAQKKKNKNIGFDINDFNQKFEIAQWLYEYDAIAWWTSDSVMAQDENELKRLGAEWFCFKDENSIWHAVYGKYADNKFDLVFHYTVDESNQVKRSKEIIDQAKLNSYSRALITANNQIQKLKDTAGIRFNQYIKLNNDQTFSVYILPAFQLNSTAVYGGEFIYLIDSEGEKVLNDEGYFSGKFRGFKVDKPREIYLNYEAVDKPTLGGIFFVWYYKEYFTNIYLETSKSRNTVMQHEDQSYYWVNAVK